MMHTHYMIRACVLVYIHVQDMDELNELDLSSVARSPPVDERVQLHDRGINETGRACIMSHSAEMRKVSMALSHIRLTYMLCACTTNIVARADCKRDAEFVSEQLRRFEQDAVADVVIDDQFNAMYGMIHTNLFQTDYLSFSADADYPECLASLHVLIHLLQRQATEEEQHEEEEQDEEEDDEEDDEDDSLSSKMTAVRVLLDKIQYESDEVSNVARLLVSDTTTSKSMYDFMQKRRGKLFNTFFGDLMVKLILKETSVHKHADAMALHEQRYSFLACDTFKSSSSKYLRLSPIHHRLLIATEDLIRHTMILAVNQCNEHITGYDNSDRLVQIDIKFSNGNDFVMFDIDSESSTKSLMDVITVHDEDSKSMFRRLKRYLTSKVSPLQPSYSIQEYHDNVARSVVTSSITNDVLMMLLGDICFGVASTAGHYMKKNRTRHMVGMALPEKGRKTPLPFLLRLFSLYANSGGGSWFSVGDTHADRTFVYAIFDMILMDAASMSLKR
jgi:hypothetical protein